MVMIPSINILFLTLMLDDQAAYSLFQTKGALLRLKVISSS